jgi:hypothetical protein
MINQQVEVAIESARGSKLLLDVVVECFRIIDYFQDKQNRMLEDEEAAFLSGQDIPPGFPEYVVALSNNHMKGTEYVETIQKRLDGALDERYRAEASKYTNNSLEGFMKVSKRGYTCLVSIIFKDISPAFMQIFSPAWYEQTQNIMGSILHTIDDYLQDFKKHLSEYLFTKLTTDCLDRFLMKYLECFRAKFTKFKMSQFSRFVKADMDAAMNFWSEYKTQKRVKQSFDLIEKIVALIESSETMIFLSWYSLWKTYNDVPISFVEEMLSKRDDLEKNAIREAISHCKEKSKESNSEAVPSLYSKVFPIQ